MVEIKLEDLVDVCRTCKGSGTLDPGPKPITSFGELGQHAVNGNSCGTCRGKGGKPTPTGQAIFDFLTWMKNKHGLSL